MTDIQFDILIDDSFANMNLQEGLLPIDNKKVLSVVNDFEAGEWRYSKFQNFVWDNIIETALSKSEREKLVNQDHSRLTSAAKKLRLTDKDNETGKGSELAEIVLYGIMKHYYKALPAVPKIFYKQNSQDNAKGADSVHIVLEDDGDFSIWFGEAKFYNSIEDARLYDVIKSVSNSLQIDKLKKENSIIANVSDLDDLIEDHSLKDNIKKILDDRTSIDLLMPKLHIPILLLHECEITKSANEMTDEYKENVINYHKERAQSYFSKQIAYCSKMPKYSEITFHLILFPVPNKGIIVDKFINAVEFYKAQ